MPFCLTFKGQFLPGIELFSATKYLGPVLDLHEVCLHCSTWEITSQPPVWDAQPSRWWLCARVRMGSVLSSQAWPSLVAKLGLQESRGTRSTPAGPVICLTGPTCNTLQTWFILLSLGKGGHYTTFCLGWQQPNIASSPQHAEQPLWSETVYIHFCALAFSGACVWCRKRQKNMQVLWIASRLK